MHLFQHVTAGCMILLRCTAHDVPAARSCGLGRCYPQRNHQRSAVFEAKQGQRLLICWGAATTSENRTSGPRRLAVRCLRLVDLGLSMAASKGNQSYLQALLQPKPVTPGTPKAAAAAPPSQQLSVRQPTAKGSQQPVTDHRTFQHLPSHLQALVLAWASAPLDTCKAAALVAADNQLAALWLLGSTKKHPLLIAAKHRLWDVCEVILESRATPLKSVLYAAIQKAAAAGQQQLVSRLLHAPGGPVVEHIEQYSWEHDTLRASLSLASSGGHHDVCHLLNQSIAYLIKAQPPSLAIYDAVRNGNVEEVCALLDGVAQRSPEDNEALAEIQHAALRTAAGAGQLGVIRAALARGADVNGGKPHFHLWSPLRYAIQEGMEEAVQVLLEQGAATHAASDGSGESALSCSASLLKEQFCRMLLSRQDVFVGKLELCAAAETGTINILMLLLESEAKMHPDLRQDLQKRAECMGAAVSSAVYKCFRIRFSFSFTRSHAAVLKALLAPPAFWGPITPAVLAEGVRGAVRALEEDRSHAHEALEAIEILAKAGADLGVDEGALLKVAAKYRHMEIVEAVIRLSPHVAIAHGAAALESNWKTSLAVELLKGGVPLGRDPGMYDKLLCAAISEPCDELFNLVARL